MHVYTGVSNDGTSYKNALNIDTSGRTAFLNSGAGFYARNISFGTGAPSGGANGDIYIQHG